MRLRTKLLLIFGISVIMLILLGTSASAGNVCAGVITGTTVNVRDKASENGTWLLTLTKDTKVIIMAHEGNWYKIGINGTIGYVFADYITPYSSGEGDYGYGDVTGSAVYMRSEPSTSGNIVGAMSEGVDVKIVGIENGWYKVQYGSMKGYMSSDYLEPIKHIVTTSSSSSRPSSSGSSISSAQLSAGQRIVETAKRYLGYRYVWGGASPSTGFDCSGLTQYVFAQCGYTLNYRTQQYRNGMSVSYENLQPGDLVFFATGSSGSISHVGIYIGNGQFIHAPHPGDVVKITSMAYGSSYYYKFVCARRIV
jgi:cell wall-associated NlpC family hydrolase